MIIVPLAFTIRPPPAGARQAKHALAGLLPGDPVLVEQAAVLVGELARGLQHPRNGRSKFAVRACASEAAVHVEVQGALDPDPLEPPASIPAVHGRGIQLVDRLADRWGVLGGKSPTIWFELDRASAQDAERPLVG
jgi:hypothetical protein